jgi:hypothetical protein
MSLVVWLRAPLGLPTIVMVWMLAFGIVAGLPIRLVAQLHDTSVAMIESHYAAYAADAMDDLVAKAIIPLTTASVEIIDLPRQVGGGRQDGRLASWVGRESEGNGRGLTPRNADDHVTVASRRGPRRSEKPQRKSPARVLDSTAGQSALGLGGRN